MNALKSRLRGFTLSEMLVVILITVIVVGLAFSILNLVQRQMNSAKNTFEKSTAVNRLRQVLWYDAQTYPNIVFNAKNQYLVFENDYDRIQYNFIADYVVRNKDTFAIELEEKIFFLEGKPIKSGQLNGIQLKTSKRTGSKTVFVYQDNAVEFYMNN